ncbi:MAG: glpA, partial [Firmicutes bacterium]|nr:glpA [Bacillota bacterium]
LTGESGEIKARQVINATGVWSDEVRQMEQQVTDRRMRPTKGVHIVLSKQDFPLNHAVFLRAPRDRRVVWPIPALNGDLVYVGTTDTDYTGPLDHITASQDDVDYLLEVANFTIPGRHLTREHVVASWAGLRPLIRPGGNVSASKTSREHQIITSPAGLLTIAGGKLTTCRVMGQQVVDAALGLLQSRHGRKGAGPSTTERHPISGGDIGPDFQIRVAETATRLGLTPGVSDRLSGRLGSNFFAVARLVEADPGTGRSLGPHNVTLAEVRYAVTDEMACTLTDFMDRRSALLYWHRDGGAAIAGAVADEMGRLLGWTETERERQIAAYRDWVSDNRTFPTAS